MKSQRKREIENVIATTVNDTAIDVDMDAIDRMKLSVNIAQALIDALAPYVAEKAEESPVVWVPKKRVRGPRKAKKAEQVSQGTATTTAATEPATFQPPRPAQPFALG